MGHETKTGAIPVVLEPHARGWRLRRGGRPYWVQGAGGERQLERLAALGGNSVRTWGAENIGGLLDRAHALGLSVTVGIWLGHKEHGFRYDDPKALQGQLEQIAVTVARYKDHPAVLLWALGNEMEVGLTPAESALLWQHLEAAIQLVQAADPAHPVMTVVAEVSEEKVRTIQRYVPSLQILGVNAYGGLMTLPQRLKGLGWTKPYLVTEFGPPGPWEVAKTAWGAPREPSSTEKAKRYAEQYARAIAAQKDWCLGSYAFFWGDKPEGTPTWFGMFLPRTEERLGPVDALAEAWHRRRVRHPCPELRALECDADGKTVAPGAPLTATVHVRGGAQARLQVLWELRREEGGWLAEQRGAIGQAATLLAPRAPGAYRLFVTIRDRWGGAATANCPFQVR